LAKLIWECNLGERIFVIMEGAFTHLGNHLISDSAAAINAGDDLSTIDPDDSLLYGQYGRAGGVGPRRRNDDDDNETETYDDDEVESLASMPIDGMKTLGLRGLEDEKELPAHACA
jgi:regulator of nonsense transcripts 1